MDDPVVPFIPWENENDTNSSADDDALDSPVIPNKIIPLRVYRYRSFRQQWKHISNHDDDDRKHPSSIRLVTWNVDALSTWVGQRINTVLDHLETEVFQCKNGEAPEPCCILLQEIHINALKVLLQHSWVKSHFATTPISREKWPFGATYGNVTLISRSITIVKAQSLEFGSSSMLRTGLMVDVKLSAPEPHARTAILRIINTHLESLPSGAVARPIQMSLLAKFIKEDNLQGGVIAGDMNAIDPDESTLVVNAGLRDSWRKGDRNEMGYTWGYQGGGEFPPARFDKIVYLPRRGYKVEEPQRIGIGLKSGTPDRQSSAIWASDHYGLDTHLRILR